MSTKKGNTSCVHSGKYSQSNVLSNVDLCMKIDGMEFDLRAYLNKLSSYWHEFIVLNTMNERKCLGIVTCNGFFH